MIYFVLLFTIVLFYLLTKNYNKYDFGKRESSSKPQFFSGDIREHEAGIIVSLMAKVAKADGRVSELEAELISNTLTELSSVFENSSAVREELKEIYKSELKTFSNTIEIANKYYLLTRGDYRQRVLLLEYLLNLAFIDNDFRDEERMICEDIAEALKIKREDFEEIVKRFEKFYAEKYNHQVNSLENAYKILNATKSDDMDTIKAKYKKLVRENHPDLLMGKGADQSTIEKATQKLQEINEAYEIIKRGRA